MVATTSPDVEVARSSSRFRPSTELRSAYRTETLELCRRAARTACVLWIAVTPAFVAIDFARYPDSASLFLAIRSVYVAANVVLLALLAGAAGRTRARELAILATAAGGALIFALMSYTGGHASPYANGMGLLILGTALLMPWSPAWSVLATGVLVASYAAYALLADPLLDPRDFVNNLSGFAVAGAIGAVSAGVRERLRWREFKNRFALERTHAEKCESEAHLRRELDANRQLIEALESANRVRSEFVSTMSHELRTPLNAILGFAEMARDPAFAAEQREAMLDRLRQAGVRLLELVDGTLEVGRIEAGRPGIELRSMPVERLWADLERGCADLVPRPGVDLEWAGAPVAGEVRTDPRKVLVILRNLVGNAVKFTDHGRVRVSLEGDDERIALTVDDTGIGIRPEDQEVIFEVFRQADGSDTRRFEGCGLGLYIVRQLVLRLGGAVRLSSEPGRGSSIVVTLPREPAEVEEPARAEVGGRRAA